MNPMNNLNFPNNQFNYFPNKKKPMSLISKPSPDEIIDTEIVYGSIKFYNENKEYGFLIVEITLEEIFVHRQQLLQAGTVMSAINSYPRTRYSFQIAQYTGKRGKAKKAVNLKRVSGTV